jgi:hypothetical protein
MNELVNDLAHLGELNDLANLLSTHVIKVLPCELLLLFDFSEDLFWYPLILS